MGKNTKVLEESYNFTVNTLLDMGKFDKAHEIATKYKEGTLTSNELVSVLVFGGEESAIDELERESEEIKKKQLEKEQQMFSGELPEGFIMIRILDPHSLPQGDELSLEFDFEEDAELEYETENTVNNLLEIVHSLHSGEITLEEAYEYITFEGERLEEFFFPYSDEDE